MNYLTNFTEEEWKYICTVIPFRKAAEYFKKNPKEFAKIKPGFRTTSLKKQTVINILYEFRKRDFIMSFLAKYINRWIKEIDEEIMKILENGINQETAYIDVLSRSFFCENVALYFKIKEEKKSKDYLTVMDSAVLYQKTRYKELTSLKKQQLEFINTQKEYENNISSAEKKIAKLKEEKIEQIEKLKEETEILGQEQDKNRELTEQVEKLEEKIKKDKENEIWKTEEMQQKIDLLTSRLNEQKEIVEKYEANIVDYTSKISSLATDIETWKNQVRNREKQIFSYKAERATLIREQETNRRQIKEMKETLEKFLNIEKNYKKQLATLNIENVSYQEKNKELEQTLEEQKDIELIESIVPPKYFCAEKKIPLSPENMDDFDEYFSYNLENIGLDMNTEGALEFVDYIEKSVFHGIPILAKRGIGINLANCLANTLYGVPVAALLSYSENAGVQKIREFLSNTPDRVVCIDGFIGNCNEHEFIPVLEQHRNKIIILTYMYDRTLRFIPEEFLSVVHYINADQFSSVLKIRDITEKPSEVKEKPVAHEKHFELDNRSQKIFKEIACECGFSENTVRIMVDDIEDEMHMNEMLMFTILPYVVNVLKENPYNCSKRLQRYAGEAGKCSKKEILIRWFG